MGSFRDLTPPPKTDDTCLGGIQRKGGEGNDPRNPRGCRPCVACLVVGGPRVGLVALYLAYVAARGVRWYPPRMCPWCARSLGCISLGLVSCLYRRRRRGFPPRVCVP